MGWFRREDPPTARLLSSGEHAALGRLRTDVRERDADRRVALEALRRLKPDRDPKALAEGLLDLCREPFGLATFYLALVDRERDLITFPLYSEGGKHRNIPASHFSSFTGLTRKAMEAGAPLYFPDKAGQEAAGVIYTDAERITGLIPESWYGVPLGTGPGWPGPPFGLLSFQAFAADAFSPSRRGIMETLGAALALALKTDPEAPLSLP